MKLKTLDENKKKLEEQVNSNYFFGKYLNSFLDQIGLNRFLCALRGKFRCNFMKSHINFDTKLLL